MWDIGHDISCVCYTLREQDSKENEWRNNEWVRDIPDDLDIILQRQTVG